MLSSLALSQSGEGDGFRTALEILRTRIPADLVVLSACDTGKGKIAAGEGIVGIDVDDHPGFARLFDKHQFAAVLNCEGSCALRACELDPPNAWRVNVLGVQNLLEQLGGTGRLVHLSIDLVFSGEGDGGHRRQDVDAALAGAEGEEEHHQQGPAFAHPVQGQGGVASLAIAAAAHGGAPGPVDYLSFI